MMDLFQKIQGDFIGLDTMYTLADGRKTRRIYLDSTASTLMMGAAHSAIREFFNHYANTHSLLHFSAKISTQEYQWAHDRVLSFLQADQETYTCFFTGSGSTAGINRLARVFRKYHPEREIAIVSLMEHHSNDLPHRKYAKKVIHIPLDNHDGQPGCIDLDYLENVLKTNRGKIKYVAVTGVSNVTGIINPIYDIAELAHDHDTFIIVDGAQMIAHLPVKISGHKNSNRNLDAFIFSGHKTYAPGSPGAVICRKDILRDIEPEEVGGGMVDNVFLDRYIISEEFPTREEAGTPNIAGAIGLAAVLEVLDTIGMDFIFKVESQLINNTLKQIKQIPNVQIYGETDYSICPRSACISFNIKDMDHGLVAAILNDYHNIAVRNECFCAHPYVKEMILDDLLEATTKINEEDFEDAFKLKSGMVRASFGIYNTDDDAEELVKAIKNISENRDYYSALYILDEKGNYVHSSFKMNGLEEFSIKSYVDHYVNQKQV